jgi:uncharacterized protein YndB with AHSA1/START domain
MIERTNFTIEPGKPFVLIERVFDAPRHLVFAAHTRPEHVARWWGNRDSTLSVCRIDLRPGGEWRYVLRMPDGSEHGFGGVYREIVPPERLVYTFRYDGYPDAEAVETLTFEERAGKTLLEATVLHQSVENRDGHVASGMEEGALESHERLAELLASLKASSGTTPNEPKERAGRAK